MLDLVKQQETVCADVEPRNVTKRLYKAQQDSAWDAGAADQVAELTSSVKVSGLGRVRADMRPSGPIQGLYGWLSELHNQQSVHCISRCCLL